MKRWHTSLRNERADLSRLSDRVAAAASNGTLAGRGYLIVELLKTAQRVEDLSARLQSLGGGEVASVEENRATSLLERVLSEAQYRSAAASDWGATFAAPFSTDDRDAFVYAVAQAWCEDLASTKLREVLHRVFDGVPEERLGAEFAGKRELQLPPNEWLKGWKPSAVDATRVLVRNYRKAWLLLSVAGHVPSVFLSLDFRVVAPMNIAESSTKAVLVEHQFDQQLLPRVLQLIVRLDSVALEGGYSSLMDILHGGGLGTGASPGLLGEGVAVVPSEQGVTSEHSCVLATAHGHRGRLGLPAVLNELTTTLIGSSGRIKIAIVLADTWDDHSFQQNHLANWRLFRDQGTVFLAFLAGDGIRGLNPLDVGLPTLRGKGEDWDAPKTAEGEGFRPPRRRIQVRR